MTRRPLALLAFVMNTPSHIYHGFWHRTSPSQADLNDLNFWIDTGRRLEAGGFDGIFFADGIGFTYPYNGSFDIQAERGIGFPVNDPLVVCSALAATTERLGLAFSAAPIQEPPFGFARRLSTLDHASKGRVAWNVITSASENGWRNFGHEELLEHDARYRLAEEYIDVLYKLWEGSWDDGALLRDRERARFGDPGRIHPINHVSENYRVEGPHLVSPSPQRTPVIFQAGASPAGREFAAKNAEAIFLLAPTPDILRQQIEQTVQLAARHGRHRDDFRFFQPLSFVVASTEGEARRRAAEIVEQHDDEGMLQTIGGSIEVDFGRLDLDTPLELSDTQRNKTILALVQAAQVDGRPPTPRELSRFINSNGRLVGTPEQIADELEKWVDAGLDGVNFHHFIVPDSFDEIAEGLLPVLRDRGLVHREAPDGTFRERLFGYSLINDRHPAARYRGAFDQRQ